MTISLLNSTLRRFEEEGICTRDDARDWVRFFSSVRRVILADPSQVETVPCQDEIIQLLDDWRPTLALNEAAMVCALDLWILRLCLEWNIDDDDDWQ